MYSFTDDRFCLSKQCRRWSNAAPGSALFAKILLLKQIVDKGLIMSVNNLVVLLTLSTLQSFKWVKGYSYKSKRESEVCSKCHMCLVKKVTIIRKLYNQRPQANPPQRGKHRPQTTDSYTTTDCILMKCLWKSFHGCVCARVCVCVCVCVCVSSQQLR